MRFDDARPGAPDVSAADAWHNGGALPLAASGARPVSGIRGYRVRIGGREAVVATSLPLDKLPEGGTPVEVIAVSGAGLEGTAVRTTLKLDRSRPAAEAEGVPDGWSREPVRVTLRGRDQPALSGVQSLAWKLDGGDEATAGGDATTVDIAGVQSLAWKLDGGDEATAWETRRRSTSPRTAATPSRIARSTAPATPRRSAPRP